MTTWFERTSTFMMGDVQVTMTECFGDKPPVFMEYPPLVRCCTEPDPPKSWWRRLFPLRAYTGEDGRGLGEKLGRRLSAPFRVAAPSPLPRTFPMDEGVS
jgi:hypothetical protein